MSTNTPSLSIRDSSLPPQDPGISLTQAAMHHVEKLIQKKTGLLGIRIGVKKAGCSGYEYTLAFAKAADQSHFD